MFLISIIEPISRIHQRNETFVLENFQSVISYPNSCFREYNFCSIKFILKQPLV